jgi:hypothetical protein
MKILLLLILVLCNFAVSSDEEMIGNKKINALDMDENGSVNSQYSYRQKKRWETSLSFHYNAASISYYIMPYLAFGFRVNDLNRIIGETPQKGTDNRPLLGGDTNALTIYQKRESRTDFGKVYPRENFFLHYYPKNSLLNNLPIYFALNLGRTYGTYREEVDYMSYLSEPIRDPDAAIDRKVIQNGYPMMYRRVSERPNYYFGCGIGYKWITSSGLSFGTEIGTSYRAKPEIDVTVMPVPWNQTPINLYDIGVMTNALKAQYESRTSFSMHYLFTVGYAF